ncbi:MAG: DUF4262 domain-containing protein [Thermoleophilia bacterium]
MPEERCRCVICEPPPPATLDAGDRGVIANVLEHGWHATHILEEDEVPEWVFSSGLTHSHGIPELAMFGLPGKQAHSWLWAFVYRALEGSPPQPGVIDGGVVGDMPIALRPVDPGWHPYLFGYARWFAQHREPTFLQVVWPDDEERWPWEEGCDPYVVQRQPDLTLPPSEHPMGLWSMALVPEPWPFADGKTSLVHATTTIAFGGAPVLGAARFEEGWLFDDGPREAWSEEDFELVCLGHVVGAHPDTAELFDLPVGWRAWREAPGEPWERAPVDEAEDDDAVDAPPA